jgi:hypothetical protein
MQAIERKLSDVAIKLIETGNSNLAQVNDEGYTALLYAAIKGMEDVAIKIIELDPSLANHSNKRINISVIGELKKNNMTKVLDFIERNTKKSPPKPKYTRSRSRSRSHSKTRSRSRSRSKTETSPKSEKKSRANYFSPTTLQRFSKHKYLKMSSEDEYDEIKKKYHKMALLLHSDKCPSEKTPELKTKEECDEEFKILNAEISAIRNKMDK